MRPDHLILAFCLLLACLAVAGPAGAQHMRLQESLPLPQTQLVSIDRLGQVYVAGKGNILHKLDAHGKRLHTFSPSQQGQLRAVEAWNPNKTLLFYEDRQQVVLLDRFLAPMTTLRLANLEQGLVRLATLASDDQLWIFNEQDFSISKIDPRYPEARLSSRLNQILPRRAHDFRLLREHQHHLYLLDRHSGLYIFDNMGTFKKKLPLTNLANLGFLGEEAYYLQGGKLVFYNLYSGQETAYDLPAGTSYQQVLAGDQVLYLFTDKQLDIYRFNR
ncbi:MAG: hypothetical protein ACO1O1_00630 [Adhaeribacter sp.]